MTYYIPTIFFSTLSVEDVKIKWHGKRGLIGVSPVYNNLEDLISAHPDVDWVEIEETLGQA